MQPMQQQHYAPMMHSNAAAAAAAAAAGAAVERKRKFNGQSHSAQQNSPSCVVFVGEIPPNTCELELRRVFHEFGKIQLIFPMPAKHQALIEYTRLSDAERLVAYHHSGPGVAVKGASVIISFSNRARIDLSQEPYLSIGAQNCLLLTIYNQKMDFNCTDVRQICSPYAIIERCVIVRQQDGLARAIVEFERLEDAALAKPFLNGANMYTGCNAIRCDYARLSAFEYFLSRESVLEEYQYEADPDAMTSLAAAVSGGGGGGGGGGQLHKRARVVPGGGIVVGGGGGLLGNPADEVGLLGTRLQGLVGGRGGGGGGIGGGQLLSVGGGSVGPSGPSGNDLQNAMSLVSRVAAAAAAANSGAVGGGPGAYGGYHHGQNIIVVRGLSPQMNCDRLFNLLVLYGNVSRVKFLTTKEGFALVEMCDPGSAQQALQHLNGQRVLGNIIRVSLSDQDNVKRNTKDFTLPDGTLAEKSYDSLKFNRFMTPESAAKNQASLGKTGRSLYFWGCPDGSNEETLREVLKEAGAPAPTEVTMQSEKGATGWITFESPQDATDAVCLANHSTVGENGRLKLSYAVNKKDGKTVAVK